eukprot:1126629-Prymnesium_polylepis.1
MVHALVRSNVSAEEDARTTTSWVGQTDPCARPLLRPRCWAVTPRNDSSEVLQHRRRVSQTRVLFSRIRVAGVEQHWEILTGRRKRSNPTKHRGGVMKDTLTPTIVVEATADVRCRQPCALAAAGARFPWLPPAVATRSQHLQPWLVATTNATKLHAALGH